MFISTPTRFSEVPERTRTHQIAYQKASVAESCCLSTSPRMLACLLYLSTTDKITLAMISSGSKIVKFTSDPSANCWRRCHSVCSSRRKEWQIACAAAQVAMQMATYSWQPRFVVPIVMAPPWLGAVASNTLLLPLLRCLVGGSTVSGSLFARIWWRTGAIASPRPSCPHWCGGTLLPCSGG